MVWKMKPLTDEIDKQILKYVRQAMPATYWSFKVSDSLARIAFISSVSILTLYVVASGFIVAAAQGSGIPKSAFDPWVSFFTSAFLIAAVPAIFFQIVRESLRVELQSTVRQAAKFI